MSLSASCSWCHTTNTLVPGVRNLCRRCGHRADLARIDCDCPKCAGLFSPPKEPVTNAEFIAAIQAARKAWKGGGS